MSEELKPCPFCGSNDLHAKKERYCPEVVCLSCGAKVRTEFDYKSAWKIWNTRHIEEDFRRQMEEAKTSAIDTAIDVAEHDCKWKLLKPYLQECDSDMPYWELCGITTDSINEAFNLLSSAPDKLAAANAEIERLLEIVKSTWIDIYPEYCELKAKKDGCSTISYPDFEAACKQALAAESSQK